MPERVLFLDRDGVINQDRPDYVRRRSEFIFLPGSLDALARLTAGGVTVVVVTNQSAVGRGLLSLDTLAEIHGHMCREVQRHGGSIRRVYFCAHTPQAGCSCRKPRPGMVLQACRDLAIDPGVSCLVGDSSRDILCARAAGCGAAVLVFTGHGAAARDELSGQAVRPDLATADLSSAATWLLNRWPV